jgi:hypothetical protein
MLLSLRERGYPMKRRSILLAVFALVFGLLPASAIADSNNAPATFDLHIEVPNISQAPNGDRVAITGSGEFSTHPKDVDAAGEFIYTDSAGTELAAGTWEATELLSFEFYGCGVVEGDPLPPDFCGGALKMRAHFTATSGPFAGEEVDGILTIFCIIGPQAPPTHDELEGEEGISLVVPGGANFNTIVSGQNIYIQTS